MNGTRKIKPLLPSEPSGSVSRGCDLIGSLHAVEHEQFLFHFYFHLSQVPLPARPSEHTRFRPRVRRKSAHSGNSDDNPSRLDDGATFRLVDRHPSPDRLARHGSPFTSPSSAEARCGRERSSSPST